MENAWQECGVTCEYYKIVILNLLVQFHFSYNFF